MTRPETFVVAGAGMTGLAAAALLATGRHAQALRLVVVDGGARPSIPDDIALRVSALSTGSVDMLDEVGAWPGVTRHCPFDHMRVWDASGAVDGVSTLHFDADEFTVPHLGVIAENVVVQCALLKVLERRGVDVRFEAPLSAVETGSRTHRVLLATGDFVDAGLIIAADGANSRVRDNVGIDVQRYDYRQVAFVTHVETELPHRATAWQRFLDDGPIGVLPLPDGRSSIVWSTAPQRAQQAADCTDDELGDLLTRVSDSVLGTMRVAGPRGSFPLLAQHARQYVRPGIALIGDAAHTVHPLAGQGANLGLRDAEVLAGVVHDALDAGEHPADRPVLRRYERARKGENAAMMQFLTGLNRLFASDSALIAELRKAGMALFNRSGPIRQRVVKVALGSDRR